MLTNMQRVHLSEWMIRTFGFRAGVWLSTHLRIAPTITGVKTREV